MRSPIVQNDDRLRDSIQKAGCLFRSLSYGAESIIANKTKGRVGPLSPEQIDQVYLNLCEMNERNQWRGMEPNCYVKNHADVIEETGRVLGVPLNAFYIESVSYDDERVRPYHSAMEVIPNFFITHRNLINGIGHFMVAHNDRSIKWDPFFPATSFSSEISFRIYRIELAEQAA